MLLWIENMRRHERAALARRLGLRASGEDLLRRPDEIAVSGEAPAVGHDADSELCLPSASPDTEEAA